METYSFQGVIHDTVMGVEIEMPFSFYMVLAPDSDPDFMPGAVNAVAYAVAEKMRQEEESNIEGKNN